MANIKYYQTVEYMGGAEVKAPRIQNEASAPSVGHIGQMYYNTADSSLYVCYASTNGSNPQWKKVGHGNVVVQAATTNPGIEVGVSTSGDTTTYTLQAKDIKNANIATNAAIAWSKLATGTVNSVLQTDSNGKIVVSPLTIAGSGTSAGCLNLGGKRIVNLGDPTDNQDAVTFATLKAWFSGNVDIHNPCDVATTGNINLSSPPFVIDGIDITQSYTAGTVVRVLVWKQTDPKQNGIYDWKYTAGVGTAQGTITMTRSADCDAGGELYAGSTTYVTNGEEYAATGFVQKEQGTGTHGSISIGTDNNVWVENYQIAKIQVAVPLNRVGNTISLNYNNTLAVDTNNNLGLAGVTVSTSGTAGAGKATTITTDSYGRVTDITYTDIAIATSRVTSGVFTLARGGIGTNTLTAHGLLVGNGTSAIKALGVGTSGWILVGSTGADPVWKSVSDAGIATKEHNHDDVYLKLSGGTITGNLTVNGTTKLVGLGTTAGIVHNAADGTLSSSLISLTSDITGTLTVAHGGTGATTLTNHGVVIGHGTGALTATAAGTANRPLIGKGSSADPTWAGYALPASLTANTILYASSTTAVGCTSTLPFTLPIAQGGTGATSALEARKGLGAIHGAVFEFSDWTSNQTKDITHSLGTDKLMVQVYEKVGTGSSAVWDKIETGLTINSTQITLSAVTGVMSGKTIRVIASAIEY